MSLLNVDTPPICSKSSMNSYDNLFVAQGVENFFSRFPSQFFKCSFSIVRQEIKVVRQQANVHYTTTHWSPHYGPSAIHKTTTYNIVSSCRTQVSFTLPTSSRCLLQGDPIFRYLFRNSIFLVHRKVHRKRAHVVLVASRRHKDHSPHTHTNLPYNHPLHTQLARLTWKPDSTSDANSTHHT